MSKNIEQTLKNMIEVELVGKSDDTFLKVVETLTRIGVANTTTKHLYQSCHILHKQGRYYLAHFKEMFKMDGRSSDISESDISRRNYIASVLQDWNLVKVLDKTKLDPTAKPSSVKIIKHSDKNKWTLKQKYAIGTVKKVNLNKNKAAS